jgi:citrate synthase
MSAARSTTLSAQEVAERLGVKVETIYAYVSRGLLTRKGADKESRFDRAEVERLRVRGRKSSVKLKKPEPLLMTTALSEITADAVFYRGKSAFDLAEHARFEHVCEWLWGVEDGSASFCAPRAAVALAHAVQGPLPEETLPLERLRVIVSVLGSTDPLRYELSRAPVVATARALIAGLIDGLPRSAHKAVHEGPLAVRLWSKLSPLRQDPARVRVLDLALSLCADHGLSPSTLATRIAASQRADPYSVVQTGLGALSGALHGAASLAAEELLLEVESGSDPSQAIGARLRRGERIPGFGQPLHPDGDPRARVLLSALARGCKGHRGVEAALEVQRVMLARGLPKPNIDFALAALARAALMVRGSSEAIMAIARSAGWIAHALEEYATPTKFPWRALYVGPPMEALHRVHL